MTGVMLWVDASAPIQIIFAADGMHSTIVQKDGCGLTRKGRREFGKARPLIRPNAYVVLCAFLRWV